MKMSLVGAPIPGLYFVRHGTPSSVPLLLETPRDGQTIPTRTTSLTLESSQSNLRHQITSIKNYCTEVLILAFVKTANQTFEF